MEGYIYLVTNLINGKKYVGKTSSTPEQRFKNHVNDSFRQYKRCNSALHDAIRKYGSEYFEVKQLEKCDINILNEREIYWIRYYNTYKDGYNSTLGGDGSMVYEMPSKEDIIQSITESKNITDLCKRYGIYQYTLNNWLAHYDIDISKFSNIKMHKKVQVGCNINGNEMKFDSLSSAGDFCIKSNITKSNNPGRVGFSIKRAIDRGGTYMGLKWYFI